MSITPEITRHVARLARLELAEDEVGAYTSQLDAIIGYVAQLERLDLDGVEGTAHAVDLTCPFRADEVQPSADRAKILGPSADQDGEHFVVPRIIE